MEHGKLHIPVNGVDVDFYPETCFDDVIDTGTDLTLTQTLASVNQSITAEATARANADAALDDKIALKVATSTYDAKMLRLDESISSLSTNKLDASTYNTKMASLDGSISGLESNKADKSTTYTKTEADELYDGKLNISDAESTYLKKSGADQLIITKTGDKHIVVKNNASQQGMSLEYYDTGNRGLYDYDNNKWLICYDNDGNVKSEGGILETVVASGNNYIRYSNGLQICWATVTFDTIVNKAWGSLYESATSTTDVSRFTFPVSFLAGKYSVTATVTSGYAFIERVAKGEGGSCGVTHLVRGSSTTNATYEVQYLVIGRWK